MSSGLYIGKVHHRRYTTPAHAFRYPLFMCLLDLEQMPQAATWRWPFRWLAGFRRSDHVGDSEVSLVETIRDMVRMESGLTPTGPILLLTHLRYFGYVMNPLSVYYCLSPDRSRIDALVLEVNNTPWGEQHCYVLPAKQTWPGGFTQRFAKSFHVSPFLGMDYDYQCRATLPGRALVFHLENWSDGQRHFDATLSLRRKPLTHGSLAMTLIRFPLMTVQVSAGIYFEALKLWFKGARYYPHPYRAKELHPNEQ